MMKPILERYAIIVTSRARQLQLGGLVKVWTNMQEHVFDGDTAGMSKLLHVSQDQHLRLAGPHFHLGGKTGVSMNRAIEDCEARNATEATIDALVGVEGGSMKVNGELDEGAMHPCPGHKLTTAIVPITEENLVVTLVEIVAGAAIPTVTLEGQAAAGIAQIPGGLDTEGIDHVREGAGLLPPLRHLPKQPLCIHRQGFHVD